MKSTNENCRYCLSIKRCKNLHGVYYYRGNKEIYRDMLHHTFNIQIPQDTVSLGICETCIQHLREATAFKNQVLQAEEDMRKQWQHNIDSSIFEVSRQHIKVKDEFDDHISIDFEFDNEDSENDDDVTNNSDWDDIGENISDAGNRDKLLFIKLKTDQIKTKSDTKDSCGSHNKIIKENYAQKISPENNLITLNFNHDKKKSCSLTKRDTYSDKIKKLQITEQNEIIEKDLNVTNSPIKLKSIIKRETYNHRIKKLLEAAQSEAYSLDLNVNNEATFDDDDDDDIEYVAEEVNITPPKNLVKELKRKPHKKQGISSVHKALNTDSGNKKRQPRPISKTEKNAKDNTLKLVLNSNMLLFYTVRLKFRCFCCKEAYTDIKDLREHSKIHTNDKYIEKRLKQIRGLTYRMVDISNLTCKLCNEKCADLNDLTKHLTEIHSFELSDGRNYLVPYRLETDNDIKCVLCDKSFNTFLRTKGHMNRHFSNNVCEVCGISYVNRVSLRVHMKIHREQKCRLCSAVFNTNYARLMHIRKFHKTSLSVRYCRICNKTFRYTYKLDEHKIKEHGAKPIPKASCGECGKIFQNSNGLKIHMRGVHLKERNYPCSVCEMRFFTKHDKNRHERTHVDIKSFACSFCDVRVKTKDSLRRHLKRQHAYY